MRFIDSHVHTYLRGADDLQAMAGSGVGGMVVCAYLPVRPSEAATLEDLFRWILVEENERAAQHGIRVRAAVGIHPRCIPASGRSRVLGRVEELLAQGAVLGEVGLETGSAEEKQVLADQLRLARATGAPVVMHTPARNKDELMRAEAALVEAAQVEPSRVVVDHLSAELVGPVRALGAHAGLTVQPGKLSADDVAAVVERYGTERLIVNSDISQKASNPRALADVARALAARKAPLDAIDRVLRANAAAVFGF